MDFSATLKGSNLSQRAIDARAALKSSWDRLILWMDMGGA